MKKSYVYKIMCKITGEFYFGSSFKAKRDSYWGTGRKIKELLAKYGKENFVKEIIEEFDDRTIAHQVENKYIEKFRHDDKCLNIHLDHRFGTYGEESRALISAAQCGEKNHNFGKHVSEETRSKMSASHRVENLSDDTRANISAAQRGKTLSEEHKAKISAAHRGKTLSEGHKANISASLRGKPKQHRKHWRKNPVTCKREWYD